MREPTTTDNSNSAFDFYMDVKSSEGKYKKKSSSSSSSALLMTITKIISFLNSTRKELFILALVLLFQLIGIILFCKGFFINRISLKDISQPSSQHPSNNAFNLHYENILNLLNLDTALYSKKKHHSTLNQSDWLLLLKNENVLNDFNHLTSLLGQSPFPIDEHFISNSTRAWMPHKFKRSIVFITDALRYDMMIPIKDSYSEGNNDKSKIRHALKDGENRSHISFPIQLYHDQMPIFGQLSKYFPERSYLCSFYADPPSATMPRIYSITTGALSTFLDAAYNFDGLEIVQDNILSQINATHSSMNETWFFGDNTWSHIYPKLLDEETGRTFCYYSFHLFDLHTIDNSIKKYLFPLLYHSKESRATSTTSSTSRIFDNTESSFSSESKLFLKVLLDAKTHIIDEELVHYAQKTGNYWDLFYSSTLSNPPAHQPDHIFAHFLGVDHCGHKSGPRSFLMANKLNEMNDLFIETASLLTADDKTLLINFGDHGMTEEGDHGGASAKELLSGIFFYSSTTINVLGVYESLINGIHDPNNDRFSWLKEKYPSFLHKLNDVLPREFSQFSHFMGKLTHYKMETLSSDDLSQKAISSFIPMDWQSKVSMQIDFAPTWALLIGLPIPFASVGVLIPELFWSVDIGKLFEKDGYIYKRILNDPSSVNLEKILIIARLQNLQWMTRAVRLASMQTLRYFLTLVKHKEPSFNEKTIASFLEKFFGSELLLYNVIHSKMNIEDLRLDQIYKKVSEFENIIENYYSLSCQMTIFGRKVWSHFDMAKLYFGVIMAIISFIMLILFVLTVTINYDIIPNFRLKLKSIFNLPSRLQSIFIMIFGFIVSFGVYFWDHHIHSANHLIGLGDCMPLFFVTCVSLLLLFFGGRLLALVSPYFKMTYSSSTYYPLAMISVLIVFHTVTPVSSSFIIFEDYVVRFMITSVLIVTYLSQKEKISSFKNFSFWILLLCANRASAWMGVCNEYQFPYCAYISHRDVPLNKYLANPFESLSPLFVILSLLLLGLILIQCCNLLVLSVNSNSSNSNWLFYFSMVSVYAYWISVWYMDSSSSHLPPSLMLSIGRRWIPLILYMILIIYLGSSILLPRKKLTYANFFLLMMPIFSIILRPFHGYFFIILFSLQSVLFDKCFGSAPAVFSVAYYHFIMYQLFFTSGHQFTIPSIQWESAFVGLTEDFHQYINGILVCLNTFVGPISVTLFFPFIKSELASKYNQQQDRRLSWLHPIMGLSLIFEFISSIQLLYHILIWTVFTPRLVFQILWTVTINILLLFLHAH